MPVRSAEEIADYMKKNDDIFGAVASSLGDLIPIELWERAGLALREGGDIEKARAAVVPITEEAIKKEILEYLPFAWEKCNNERGLSAGRSIIRFRAWCFALGDEEASAFLDEDSNYPDYGRPMLTFLSDRFGYTGER